MLNGNLAVDVPPVTELIEGKVCLMSPRPCVDHNLVSSRIYRIFANYLEGKTCMALSDGYDVFLDEENHYVPDGMIVCDRSKIRPKGIYGAPDLVVEVLSHSTMLHDRGPKMRHYAEAGVKEYWIVTPEARTVEVYWNENGRFELAATYADYLEEDLEFMDDDERAAIATEIPVSLYDDFRVSVKEIFLDLDAITR
ncbi:Uma2 family endonuclease [uncultured Selenomonas sp.]|uniref:Uma2 family endonuclease n=1 Tax=uncultured Selenomonas sp. TaxID=159275 RepID=UPI0025F7D55A|nr:Uma2 family endonuclease [uncultured Selenomonas sp.]